MKIIRDSIDDASQVINETESILNEMQKVKEGLRPYQPGKEKLGNFLIESKNILSESISIHFKEKYPAISNLVLNGASNRLIEALYRYRYLSKQIVDRKFVVKLTEDRNALTNFANGVIEDLIVFLIDQFELYSAQDEIQMSIANYCKRLNITPEILYEQLLKVLRNAGGEFNGYEKCSAYYSSMQRYYDQLVAEAEEKHWKLPDSLCIKLLSGEITLQQCYDIITQDEMGTVETETSLTPALLLGDLKTLDFSE